MNYCKPYEVKTCKKKLYVRNQDHQGGQFSPQGGQISPHQWKSEKLIIRVASEHFGKMKNVTICRGDLLLTK